MLNVIDETHQHQHYTKELQFLDYTLEWFSNKTNKDIHACALDQVVILDLHAPLLLCTFISVVQGNMKVSPHYSISKQIKCQRSQV